MYSVWVSRGFEDTLKFCQSLENGANNEAGDSFKISSDVTIRISEDALVKVFKDNVKEVLPLEATTADLVKRANCMHSLLVLGKDGYKAFTPPLKFSELENNLIGKFIKSLDPSQEKIVLNPQEGTSVVNAIIRKIVTKTTSEIIKSVPEDNIGEEERKKLLSNLSNNLRLVAQKAFGTGCQESGQAKNSLINTDRLGFITKFVELLYAGEREDPLTYVSRISAKCGDSPELTDFASCIFYFWDTVSSLEGVKSQISVLEAKKKKLLNS